MSKRYILFDLDGTITDSSEGITKSVQHALKKLGIEENDQAMLRRFIGPPLDESFENQTFAQGVFDAAFRVPFLDHSL